MSRRSRRKRNNSNSSSILIGSIVAIIAIIFGYTFLNQSDTPAAKDFPLESYIHNGNSLRGSEYSISGEIIENAQHDPTVGKFVLIKVDTSDQSISPDLPNSVGILVPAEVDGPNLETKQNYNFVVDVRKEGALVATSYTAK
ncbi:hypothetical protein ACFPK9_01875 [Rubritalea spongiae]|uniref:Uncharacterized protein n=1 Tax=Rubritalea spongiae TaxID=430797 RepID=A0ABW5E2W1_9BACT